MVFSFEDYFYFFEDPYTNSFPTLPNARKYYQTLCFNTYYTKFSVLTNMQPAMIIEKCNHIILKRLEENVSFKHLKSNHNASILRKIEKPLPFMYIHYADRVQKQNKKSVTIKKKKNITLKINNTRNYTKAKIYIR